MRRFLVVAALLWAAVAPVRAAGLLIPTEKKVPPLAMLNHVVNVTIEDQVAITHVEQVFRNHTDRQLEATYVFPVPKGASVRKFSMWVDGKKVDGEMVEADKARQIYNEIVSRTNDPGLLEYVGNNLLQLRVFPVLAKSDQKIAVSFTSIAASDNGMIEYVYPLKTNGKAASTLEKFEIKVALKSQHPVQNIYSPTHAITTNRPNDRQAVIGFEKDQAQLDTDFQLYYTLGNKDVGLTALTHRPSADQNGYFMMLINPRAELAKEQQVPRDMVLVLDTSGSMRGKRMTQARHALKYCLSNLAAQDRFTILNFATTVNRYTTDLQPATPDNIAAAKKWVDALEATGGTAINDALLAGLGMRPEKDEGRTFNMVFFTDGRPTIGETNAERILKNAGQKNSGNTRIFTFGVGDDVNASMLDQLAESSRAISTYVRETEDIEAKVSGLYSKISNPVLTGLKLEVTGGISINEVYPPQLPDLFHGSQLVVLGRYNGKGHAAIKLTGQVGKANREYVYELSFPDKTTDEKPFVEDLWARRKVGYLLDQIRINGDKKELVEEVVTLAKRYGITTPYTSYLVVPDAPTNPVARRPAEAPKNPAGKPEVAFKLPDTSYAPTPPPLVQTTGPAQGSPGSDPAKAEPPAKLEDVARKLADQAAKGQGEAKEGKKDLAGGFGGQRIVEEEKQIQLLLKDSDPKAREKLTQVLDQRRTFDDARDKLARGDKEGVQNGNLGVNLSVYSNNLRFQNQVSRVASRNANSRNLLEIGGVWIDDAFNAKMEAVNVKAMSKAYFRLLERQPKMREVFQLGTHIVWVTPSGQALIIDQAHGQEELTDAVLDRLFVAPAKKE